MTVFQVYQNVSPNKILSFFKKKSQNLTTKFRSIRNAHSRNPIPLKIPLAKHTPKVLEPNYTPF